MTGVCEDGWREVGGCCVDGCAAGGDVVEGLGLRNGEEGEGRGGVRADGRDGDLQDCCWEDEGCDGGGRVEEA